MPHIHLVTHRARTDAALAAELHTALEELGHEVFIDQQMPIGTEWAKEIAERIDWCDALLVLLSSNSISSEMMQEEVRLAHHRRRQDGTPAILPVRIAYDGPLGYALGAYIERLQHAVWSGPQDTPGLLAKVGETFNHARSASPRFLVRTADAGPTQMPRPSAAADPRLLKRPGGGLMADDPAYIERPADSQIVTEAAMRGMTIVMKAPRQSGKTSLLVRYLSRCRTRQACRFRRLPGSHERAAGEPCHMPYTFFKSNSS